MIGCGLPSPAFIKPVRALMDEFMGGVQMDLIYRASKEEDLILRDELDYLAVNSAGSIRVHYLVGSRKNRFHDESFSFS